MERVECLSALDCVRLSDLDTQINYLGCLLTCDKSKQNGGCTIGA